MLPKVWGFLRHAFRRDRTKGVATGLSPVRGKFCAKTLCPIINFMLTPISRYFLLRVRSRACGRGMSVWDSDIQELAYINYQTNCLIIETIHSIDRVLLNFLTWWFWFHGLDKNRLNCFATNWLSYCQVSPCFHIITKSLARLNRIYKSMQRDVAGRKVLNCAIGDDLQIDNNIISSWHCNMHAFT